MRAGMQLGKKAMKVLGTAWQGTRNGSLNADRNVRRAKK